ncbi:MAG: hypothetical protein COV37_07335 [Bdellovibrio sp. CG11_big_fil_rev_8_21_14_0_20_39_38]|nr:MAG: hypothetical protein COV37_07335 [Bdellovibrio sp. CG11_big_fil_rev_8_21_14_0_20_39_38]
MKERLIFSEHHQGDPVFKNSKKCNCAMPYAHCISYNDDELAKSQFITLEMTILLLAKLYFSYYIFVITKMGQIISDG